MVMASDLSSTGRGFDSQPFHYQVASLGKLFTHMCLCHQAVHFGTGQRAVMLCGREGNRRPGVALAMRHRLHNNNNRICIAQVCRMTSEALVYPPTGLKAVRGK